MIVSAPRGIALHSARRQEALRRFRVTFDRRVEERPHEARARGVLGGGVAPRAQRVAELERDGHVRERVEIDEAQRAIRRRARTAGSRSSGSPCTMRSRLAGSGGNAAAASSTRSASGSMTSKCRCARCSTSASRSVRKCLRRVVHAEAAVAEPVLEIADGAMELRDDAPRRARLRRASRARRGTRRRCASARATRLRARARARRRASARGAASASPLLARCSVTAAMSMFTSAEKIGFTRCSTRAAPRARVRVPSRVHEPRRRAHERLGLEVEGLEHGRGRDEIRVSAHRRHDSRKPADARGRSQSWTSNCARIRPVPLAHSSLSSTPSPRNR